MRSGKQNLCLYHLGFEVLHTSSPCIYNATHFHHPDVIDWLLGENPQLFSIPFGYRKKAEEQRRGTEPGIAGSTLQDSAAAWVYSKYMKKLNKKDINPLVIWDTLREREATVAQQKVPPMSDYWCAKLHGTVTERKAQFKKLLNESVRLIESEKNLKVRKKWRLAWDAKPYPISVALYYPGKLKLVVNEWVLDNFRRCDVVIIALHELIGHHYQESNTYTESSEEAEGCAMRCEKLASSFIWENAKGDLCSLAAASKDWELFRILRACVDLRLHSRQVRKKYPRKTESLWTNHPSMKHIVPLPSELHRCASLPAQALGYVMHNGKYKGCAV